MQLNVARRLNSLLIGILVLVLVLAGGYFYVARAYPDGAHVYLYTAIFLFLVLFFFYKWMENNWDKRVITRMAKNGKIALANIRKGERAMPMRDSTMTQSWLFRFSGDLLTPDGEVLKEVTFYEKMNAQTGRIPFGTVFVTYDPLKPRQIFIIPSALISHLPDLAPVVEEMEKSPQFPIRYLCAVYNKGMVLETFRAARGEQVRAGREQKAQKKKALSLRRTGV